jgi:CysZ protein
MLLGALPAFIVGSVYAVGIVAFAMNLDVIAAWATPFVDDWATAPRYAVRFFIGVALVAGVVILGVFTFVAVTLTVGDPFYERIWRAVEARLGDAPADLEESFWSSASRGLGNGIRLFLATASVGLLLFAAGFVPVVGQLGAPIAGALLGGWFLSLELSGFAFDARGLRLRDRRRMLGSRRATTLGFGIATYLLFLIPGAAVIVMPAAVAGATMLARDSIPDSSR